MLLFGSRDVTHPTRERRIPCSVGLEEKQKAPAGLESAAQAIDGVELD